MCRVISESRSWRGETQVPFKDQENVHVGWNLESQVRTATGGAMTVKWSGFYPGGSGRFRRTVGRGISEQFYILEDLSRG